MTWGNHFKKFLSHLKKLLSQETKTVGNSLAVSVFDKLFIGAIVLAVGYWVQAESNHQARVTELTAQFLQQQNEFLSSDHKAVVEQLSTYVRLLDEAKAKDDPVTGTADALSAIISKLDPLLLRLEAQLNSDAPDKNLLLTPLNKGVAVFEVGDDEATIANINSIATDIVRGQGEYFRALQKAALVQALGKAQEVAEAADD